MEKDCLNLSSRRTKEPDSYSDIRNLIPGFNYPAGSPPPPPPSMTRQEKISSLVNISSWVLGIVLAGFFKNDFQTYVFILAIAEIVIFVAQLIYFKWRKNQNISLSQVFGINKNSSDRNGKKFFTIKIIGYLLVIASVIYTIWYIVTRFILK